jgi:hypothetical protein
MGCPGTHALQTSRLAKRFHPRFTKQKPRQSSAGAGGFAICRHPAILFGKLCKAGRIPLNWNREAAMTFLTKPRALVFAAAFGVVLAAPAAQAFTFEQGATNSDGTAKFTTPDSRFFNSGSTTNSSSSTTGNPTYRSGNTSLQFGGSQSQSQRYNVENMFNPNGRPMDR